MNKSKSDSSVSISVAFDDSNNLYHLKIADIAWELNIHLNISELKALENIKSAIWDDRTTIEAGTSANASVHWAYQKERYEVAILVGHDAETWDFGVLIPTNILEEALQTFVSLKQ